MHARASSWMLAAAAGVFALSAPRASAQIAAASVTVQVNGTVAAPGAEPVVCSGQASIASTAVIDPTIKPFSVVTVDVTGLACRGAVTNAAYSNTGRATLTRPLAATDLVETTFAVQQDAPGGYLKARTALLRLNLVYHPLTGALLSATGTIGSLP